MISTCRRCGRLYEFQSEEDANSPDRLCRNCYIVDPDPVPAHLLDGETTIFKVPHGNCALTRDHAPIECQPRQTSLKEALQANARIRTEPFPPTRTHDAQGVRRTGYRPEEDEGEE